MSWELIVGGRRGKVGGDGRGREKDVGSGGAIKTNKLYCAE